MAVTEGNREDTIKWLLDDIGRLYDSVSNGIDAEHAAAISGMVDYITAAGKSNALIEQQVRRSLEHALKIAHSYRGGQIVALAEETAALNVEENAKQIIENRLQLSLAESFRNFGTFYSGVYGYALITSQPVGLAFSLDRLFNIRGALDELADEEIVQSMVRQVAAPFISHWGEMYAAWLRFNLYTTPIPMRNGRAAVLSASGRLAKSIGVLDDSGVQRSAGGKKATLSTRVGIKGDARAEVYGGALARTQPVFIGSRIYSPERKQHLEEWAKLRGISTAKTIIMQRSGARCSQLDLIMAKIARSGISGRGWLAYIIKTQSGSSPIKSDIPRFTAALGHKINSLFK